MLANLIENIISGNLTTVNKDIKKISTDMGVITITLKGEPEMLNGD